MNDLEMTDLEMTDLEPAQDAQAPAMRRASVTATP
jgi:hypothetical protein